MYLKYVNLFLLYGLFLFVLYQNDIFCVCISGFASRAIAVFIVCILSTAETPVVTPSLASIEIVKAVCLTVDSGISPDQSPVIYPEESRTVTAGRESHPAPKNAVYKNRKN